MEKAIICLSVAVILSFFLVQVTQADELSELKTQMRAMQKKMQEQTKELEEQKKQIDAMQKKVEQLEAQAPAPVEGPKPAISREILEKFHLGGEACLRFVDTQKDASVGEADPHFEMDKVQLAPEIQITDDIRFEAALDIEEGGAKLDECYFIFQNLPLNSTLQIGKDDRFFKAERYTERYPLAGNSFWRDEEVGILLETEHDPFYAAFSLSNGLELSTKQPGQASAYNLIHDNTKSSDYLGLEEISAGVGLKGDLGDLGEIDILGFNLWGELSGADVQFLKDNLNSYTSNDNDQYRIGVNVDYSLADFNVVFQYIDAEDGGLDRYAWFIQPSYKLTLPYGWKYCNEHRVLVRYGKLDVDNDRTSDKPATWDREEVTIAIITDITQNFRLISEYTIDSENTGGIGVQNNELVMQLEYEF